MMLTLFLTFIVISSFPSVQSFIRRHNTSWPLLVQRRPKRIVDGLEIDRDSPFKVTQYNAWLGYTWDCYEDLPWWKKMNILGRCPEKPERLMCGGALIAPRIVQTACHCITYQYDRVFGHWKKAAFLHDLTNVNVYVGFITVADMVDPILSTNFVFDEHCAALKYRPRVIRYDFAWVVLEKPVTKRVGDGRWHNLDYAGPYELPQMRDLYDKAMTQMYVCLVVGFGLTDDQRYSPSGVLKFAWIQLLSWIHCYDIIYTGREFDFEFPYNFSASWVCAVRMGYPIGGRAYRGDSGAPVTCNNVYFAVVSGALTFAKTRSGITGLMYHQAILYATRAMVTQYRDTWEASILRARKWTKLPRTGRSGMRQQQDTCDFPQFRWMSGLQDTHQSSTARVKVSQSVAGVLLYLLFLVQIGS